MRLVTLFLVFAVASCVRIGIVNDIHLNQTFDFGCSWGHCYDLGRFGYDSPASLVQIVLNDMATRFGSDAKGKEPKLDFILVVGDLVVHGLSSRDPSTNNWPEMQSIIQEVVTLLQTNFPDIPILISIGNNDVVYHYQAANTTFKSEYYGDMFKYFFEEVPTNSAIPNLEEIYTTFIQGGYYRYNYSDSLAVLSLNSIILNSDNDQDLEEGPIMLQWMEDQFAGSPDTKFILFGHIWPGLNYFEGVEQFWYDGFLQEYLRILNEYDDQVVVNLGAHTHSGDIRSPISASYRNLFSPILVSPALSPVYDNNPGYTILDYSDSKGIEDYTYYFFELYLYNYFKWKIFQKVKPASIFRMIDYNDGRTIQDLTRLLAMNAQEFGRYMAMKNGYPWIYREIAATYYPILWLFGMLEMQAEYTCAMLYYDLDNYNDCVSG